MGWFAATEYWLMFDIWPLDTTASMDRHQRAAAVGIAYGTVTSSQMEGRPGFSCALYYGLLRETEKPA